MNEGAYIKRERGEDEVAISFQHLQAKHDECIHSATSKGVAEQCCRQMGLANCSQILSKSSYFHKKVHVFQNFASTD